MNQSVIISTRTIVHPCLEVSVINIVSEIPSITCNKKQALHAVQRQPICIADEDCDYILDEIELCYNIKYRRKVHNDKK